VQLLLAKYWLCLHGPERLIAGGESHARLGSQEGNGVSPHPRIRGIKITDNALLWVCRALTEKFKVAAGTVTNKST